MLDLKFVVANTAAVKQNCRNRNVSPDVLDDIDRVVELEGERRGLLQTVEEIRRRQNEIAQATGRERDQEKRGGLIEDGKRLKSSVADLEERLRRLEAEMNQRLRRIPNLTHPDAPVGLTEDDSRELRKVGTPRVFDFKPRDHVELGKALDLIDFETAGKVSGTGFYFLKNDAVLLDLALQQFAIALERAWIFSQVFCRPELGGIHKDRGGHDLTRCFRCAHHGPIRACAVQGRSLGRARPRRHSPFRSAWLWE